MIWNVRNTGGVDNGVGSNGGENIGATSTGNGITVMTTEMTVWANVSRLLLAYAYQPAVD